MLLQPLCPQVWRVLLQLSECNSEGIVWARMNKDQIWMNKDQICWSLPLHQPSPPFLSLSSWAVRKASVSVLTSWPPPSSASAFQDIKEGLCKSAWHKEMKRQWEANTLCILIYICFRACPTGACSTCLCHASKAKNKGMRLTEFFCVLPRIKFVFPCLTFNSPKTRV